MRDVFHEPGGENRSSKRTFYREPLLPLIFPTRRGGVGLASGVVTLVRVAAGC